MRLQIVSVCIWATKGQMSLGAHADSEGPKQPAHQCIAVRYRNIRCFWIYRCIASALIRSWDFTVDLDTYSKHLAWSHHFPWCCSFWKFYFRPWIPRKQRIYVQCNQVEDEEHFFPVFVDKYINLRITLFNKLHLKIPFLKPNTNKCFKLFYESMNLVVLWIQNLFENVFMRH